MSPAELHADSIVIDGLIIAKWSRDLFEDMRKGPDGGQLHRVRVGRVSGDDQ